MAVAVVRGAAACTEAFKSHEKHMRSTPLLSKVVQVTQPSSLTQHEGAAKHQPRSPCVFENTYRIGYPPPTFPGGLDIQKDHRIRIRVGIFDINFGRMNLPTNGRIPIRCNIHCFFDFKKYI
jgi:hypothetical protein